GTDPVMCGPLDDVTATPMATTYAPIFSQSEYCANCHSDAREIRVQQLDDQMQATGPIYYRNIWGEDTYREWRYAPASALAVQPFGGGPTYLPRDQGPFLSAKNYAGKPLACQDCHMTDPPPDVSTGETIADYADPAKNAETKISRYPEA